MPTLSYQQAGLVLKRPRTGASDAQIRDLQRHLRALGYLRQGIDGAFGPGEGLLPEDSPYLTFRHLRPCL